MRKFIVFSIALLFFSFGATMQSCKSTKSNMNENNVSAEKGQMSPDISGSWILKSLNGSKGEEMFKDKMPSMTVDFSTQRINGNGGCNSYNGPFSLSNGIFSAPNLAATMMMCPNGNQEAQFFAMLAKQNKASIVNGVLTFSNDGKTVAEFVKGIDAQMLTGEWTLDQIENEDTKALFSDIDLPTLKFDMAENRIAGNAGCNGYGAPYTIKGTELEVKNPISTRRACANMAGEGKFIQAITGTSTVNVTGDELTLSKNGKVVLKFKKQ